MHGFGGQKANDNDEQEREIRNNKNQKCGGDLES
jgi:hypothetical protein